MEDRPHVQPHTACRPCRSGPAHRRRRRLQPQTGVRDGRWRRLPEPVEPVTHGVAIGSRRVAERPTHSLFDRHGDVDDLHVGALRLQHRPPCGLVRPHHRDPRLDLSGRRDGGHVQHGPETFADTGNSIATSAWSLAVPSGTTLDAWIQAYCPLAESPAPSDCTTLPGRTAAASMDGHAGSLVRFTGDTQAFFLVNGRPWRPSPRRTTRSPRRPGRWPSRPAPRSMPGSRPTASLPSLPTPRIAHRCRAAPSQRAWMATLARSCGSPKTRRRSSSSMTGSMSSRSAGRRLHPGRSDAPPRGLPLGRCTFYPVVQALQARARRHPEECARWPPADHAGGHPRSIDLADGRSPRRRDHRLARPRHPRHPPVPGALPRVRGSRPGTRAVALAPRPGSAPAGGRHRP